MLFSSFQFQSLKRDSPYLDRLADSISSSGPSSSPIAPSQSLASARRVSPSLHPKAVQTPNNSTMDALSKLLQTNQVARKSQDESRAGTDIERVASQGYLVDYRAERRQEPHHIHVYATKHNTHITITRPDNGPIISKSAGSLGFKHSQRKHYDSAFQLAAYVFGKLHESGKSRDITKIAVIMRGFGAGREAVTKALLGSEGRYLRGKIVSVSDSTRVKFGGTRSKKARRLG